MPRWRLALLCAALFALSASLWWATAVWAVLPFGSTAFHSWSLLWIAAFLLALFGLPASLLAAVFRKARRKALGVSAVCAAILLGWGVGIRVGATQKTKRSELIPARAAPLIMAIQAFERDHRRPPDRLEDLVPGYIAAIPATGLGGHPAWSYERAPFVEHRDHSDLLGENTWALSLYVPGRYPSYRMLYLPDRRYPSTATRVGEWARMHY